jgi:aarF domain-containing kinase
MLVRTWARRGAIGVAGGFGLAYASSPGFRRSVRFWSTVSPFFVEYGAIKARARWEGVDPADDIAAFHQRSASKAVAIILQLGGIYVKVGQFASTMGAGILEDTYVQALRPLQDGVPPRSIDEVRSIIEASVGRTMDELFLSFDAVPVGAASIAQAHRATLLDGREVIVKVSPPSSPLALVAASLRSLPCSHSPRTAVAR